jgi:hypothetical protein
VPPELVSATFSALVGDRFEIAPGDGPPFEATLTSCSETPHGVPDEWRRTVGRVPFALLFHGDPPAPVRQQICTLSHHELGRFELFLVPLGPDERGMRFEAVIS